MMPGSESARAVCSRAGCTADAAWRLEWRNPRIHGPERVKVWLACDEHRDHLRDFLAAREFPLAVKPFERDRGDDG